MAVGQEVRAGGLAVVLGLEVVGVAAASAVGEFLAVAGGGVEEESGLDGATGAGVGGEGAEVGVVLGGGRQGEEGSETKAHNPHYIFFGGLFLMFLFLDAL